MVYSKPVPPAIVRVAKAPIVVTPPEDTTPMVSADEPVLIDYEVSGTPPPDLPEEQHDFWRRYGALAIDKRTLTQHTIAAFRLLCEQDAEKQALKATIDRDGRTYLKVTVDGSGQEHDELKAHPLTSHYGRTAKAVEQLMARFGLAPFGKAEPIIAKKPAANPWAKVAEK